MPRIVRNYNLYCAPSASGTFTFGTSSGTLAVPGLLPPEAGAFIEKWWLRVGTVGTGTQTLTVFPVFSGGTSSTSAVAGSIIVDIDATGAPYTLEGAGLNPPYIFTSALTNVGANVDIVYTANTTATNAISGVAFGVIWAI